MAQNYITQGERWLRDFIEGHYDIRYQAHYATMVPYISRCLIQQFGADDAINLLDQVMASVQRRLDRSRSSLTIYELQTYLDWIDTIKNRVASIQHENANRPARQPEVARGLLKNLMRAFVTKPISKVLTAE